MISHVRPGREKREMETLLENKNKAYRKQKY